MGLFSEDLRRCRMDNTVHACHGPIWHVVCSDDRYALAGGQPKALATLVQFSAYLARLARRPSPSYRCA